MAANIPKARLKLMSASYVQLAELSCDKVPNVRDKLGSGKFLAAYSIKCLSAIETQTLELYS